MNKWILIVIVWMTVFSRAEARQLPKWELGLAAGVISIPEYMGSDERYTLPLAAPYIVYRGEKVKADREGVRGLLLETNNLSVDLGFSFGLPVENENKAREGMPDLHLSGQVGPRLNWKFDSEPGQPQLGFHLPVRYALDIKGNNMGWVAEPSFRLKKRSFLGNPQLSGRMDVGLLYATDRYNRYYYEVAPEYATTSRSVYSADSGLHSIFLKFSTSYQYSKRMKMSAFIHLRSMEYGVVEDSPLVENDLDISAGIGFSWTFWHSETMVESDARPGL